MGTIPIRLDDEIIKKIDILVKNGKYKNRTDALRDQIIKGLEKISIFDSDSLSYKKYDEILKKMLSLKKPPNLLRTEKSVVDMIAEGRER